MATGGVWFGRLDSLGARIGALLSLAILPLGLIAIVQSYRVLDEATQRLDEALIGEALRVTRSERGVVQSALGAAQAIAATLPNHLDPLEQCRSHLATVTDRLDGIHFAGFIPNSGVMACTSEGDVQQDFSESPAFVDLAARPRVVVRATERGYVTERPAVLVTVPVTGRGGADVLGFLTLSLTHRTLTPDADINPDRVPIDILTFNEMGQVLTATLAAEAADLLPQNQPLADLVGSPSRLFRDTSVGGEDLIYSVTPIVEETVYALTVWPQSIGTGPGDLLRWTLPTILLPVLMWIASLSVAYFAVHRLIIGHVRRLRKRMRVFSRFRRIEAEPDDAALPAELREVTETFVTMAHTIQREEAELENSLREKELLLREVYHRVRNNLQLIASMNNMQIRAAEAAETKRTLRRLQDRIMALSTIHAALYQAPALSKIRVNELVVTLARQVVAKAASGVEVEVKAEMSETRLYPDLAVPLALLTVEAVTNAVKHLGTPPDGSAPWIAVRLSEAEGLVCLEIRNSVGPDVRAQETPETGGLGQKLIDAFTVQLGAELEIEETDDTYTLTVEFRPSDYGEEHSLI
jgi:two-component sensor histidine kinase